MERKTFALATFAETPDGVFGGYASVFGVVDAGGDVVVRGAFAKALPAFIRDGFVSWNHDWGQPVAVPLAAHEDETGLWLAGRFHSTPEAQRARTIVRERMDQGLRSGLSIGYAVAASRPLPGGLRALTAIDPLYEVGLVMVPMNRESNVAAIKRLDPTCRDDACVLDAVAAIEAESVLARARSLGVVV